MNNKLFWQEKAMVDKNNHLAKLVLTLIIYLFINLLRLKYYAYSIPQTISKVRAT